MTINPVLNLSHKEIDGHSISLLSVEPYPENSEPIMADDYVITLNVTKAADSLIQIDASDQSCQTDNDCIMAMTECSCDCGKPINKEAWPKYLDMQDKMCEDYDGPQCDMDCNPSKCINEVCTVVDAF